MNAYLSLLEDKNVVVDDEAVHEWVTTAPLNDTGLRVKVSQSKRSLRGHFWQGDAKICGRRKQNDVSVEGRMIDGEKRGFES